MYARGGSTPPARTGMETPERWNTKVPGFLVCGTTKKYNGKYKKRLAIDGKSAEYADIAPPYPLYPPYSEASKPHTPAKSIENSQGGNIVRIAPSSHFTASIIPE